MMLMIPGSPFAKLFIINITHSNHTFNTFFKWKKKKTNIKFLHWVRQYVVEEE